MISPSGAMLGADRWGESVTVVRTYGDTPLREGDVISRVDDVPIGEWVAGRPASSRARRRGGPLRSAPAGAGAGPAPRHRGATHPLPGRRRGVPQHRDARPVRDAAVRGIPGLLAPATPAGGSGVSRRRIPGDGAVDVVALRPRCDRPRRVAWHLAAPGRRGGVCGRDRHPPAHGAAVPAGAVGIPRADGPPPLRTPSPGGLRRVGAARRPVAGASRRPPPGPDHGRRARARRHGAGGAGVPARAATCGHPRETTDSPPGWCCWRSWVASRCGSCSSTCPAGSPTIPSCPWEVLALLLAPAVLTCLVVAMLRYRLDEIEPTVRRTLVQAMVATLVGGVFVAVAGAVNLASDTSFEAMVAGGVVALLLLPLAVGAQPMDPSTRVRRTASAHQVVAELRRLDPLTAPTDACARRWHCWPGGCGSPGQPSRCTARTARTDRDLDR